MFFLQNVPAMMKYVVLLVWPRKGIATVYLSG